MKKIMASLVVACYTSGDRTYCYSYEPPPPYQPYHPYDWGRSINRFQL
jgi:hypothetical protein